MDAGAEMRQNQKLVSKIGVVTLLFNVAKSANLVLGTSAFPRGFQVLQIRGCKWSLFQDVVGVF